MTLKLMGVEKVIAAIKDVNSELNVKIDAEIDAQAQMVATKAKRKAPSNFSELRNSIGTEKVSVPPELTEVAAAVKGRASRGNFASMVEAIYVWGTKKKIIKKGDKNHAVNIARKIMINGIAPQPFLWPSFLEVRPKLISRLQTILKSANL